MNLNSIAAQLAAMPKRLRPKEAAKYLDVSVRTLEDWRRQGVGPRYHRVGSRIIQYAIADLEAFLMESKH